MPDRDFDGSGITDPLREILTSEDIVKWDDVVIKDALLKAIDSLGEDLDAGVYEATELATASFEALDVAYTETLAEEVDDEEDELFEDEILDDDDEEE